MEEVFSRISKFSPTLAIRPRYKALYFGQDCDLQSLCAKTAREILSLLEKKRDIPHQNKLIKEEIWKMLDHEKLLSDFGCCALAKLTIRELLRLMSRQNNNIAEELILFIEEMDIEMPKLYSLKPMGPCPHNIQALQYKHLGQGMQYLKEMQTVTRKKSES